jgi:hypothetical protein
MPKIGILLDRRRWLSRAVFFAARIETINAVVQQSSRKFSNYFVKAVIYPSSSPQPTNQEYYYLYYVI